MWFHVCWFRPGGASVPTARCGFRPVWWSTCVPSLPWFSASYNCHFPNAGSLKSCLHKWIRVSFASCQGLPQEFFCLRSSGPSYRPATYCPWSTLQFAGAVFRPRLWGRWFHPWDHRKSCCTCCRDRCGCFQLPWVSLPSGAVQWRCCRVSPWVQTSVGCGCLIPRSCGLSVLHNYGRFP